MKIIKLLLNRIAKKDIKKFFDLINEVAHNYGKFVPFLLDIPPPKTEEEKETERKFLEEQRKICEYKEKYPGELLAFTKRDDELVLVSHGISQEEVHRGITDAIKQGRYDNKNEAIFYE